MSLSEVWVIWSLIYTDICIQKQFLDNLGPSVPRELDFWLAASPAATGVMVPCSLSAEKLNND